MVPEALVRDGHGALLMPQLVIGMLHPVFRRLCPRDGRKPGPPRSLGENHVFLFDVLIDLDGT